MKKKINMDKLKNAVIVVLSLIIVFGIAFVVPELRDCGSCTEKLEITQISASEYKDLLAGEEVSLIYIASPTCGYCVQQKPIMQQLLNKYKFPVNYVDVSAISNSDSDNIYNTYKDLQKKEYSLEGVRTPTILLVQKGKVLDMNLGTMPLEKLVEFIEQYTEITEE